MQLLNLKTFLTAPEGPVTESAKHSPDTDLTGISAQFSGLLNTAMQEKAAPPSNVPQVAASQTLEGGKTLSDKLQDAPLQEAALDVSLPTPPENVQEARTPAKSPSFPLNIIASLQSLLNPQSIEKPNGEKPVQGNTNPAEPKASEMPLEVQPPSYQETAGLKDELPASSAVQTEVVAQATVAPKTDAQTPNDLQNNVVEKNLEVAVNAPETDIAKSAVSTPAEKPSKSSTEKKSEKTTTKEETSQPQAFANTQNIPSELLSAMALSSLNTPQGLPQNTVQTQPAASSSIQSVTTESSAPLSPKISQGNVAIPNNAMTPLSGMQTIPNPSGSPNTTTAASANTPNAAPATNAQEPAPLPQEAQAVQIDQTEDTASFASAMSSAAIPPSPQTKSSQKESSATPQISTAVFSGIGNKNTDSTQNTASANVTQSVQTPASLNTLQDIGNKLNAMKGQVESSRHDSDELKTDARNDAGPAITDSTPSPLLAPIPLEHAAQTTSTNTVSTDAKIPAFVPSAAHPADQVVEGTVYSVKNGHQELVIRLNPDNLGEVRVNLSTSGKDGLSARLIASSAESQEVLQSHLSHLKTSLEAQGVQLDRVSVVIAGNTESSGSHMGQQSQQHHFRQQDSQQQQAAQQDFNQQQNQSNAQMAFNLNQQGGNHANKSAYAQAPSGGSSGRQESAGNTAAENTSTQKRNDNGKISILA